MISDEHKPGGRGDSPPGMGSGSGAGSPPGMGSPPGTGSGLGAHPTAVKRTEMFNKIQIK